MNCIAQIFGFMAIALLLSVQLPCRSQTLVIPLHRAWTGAAMSSAIQDSLRPLHTAEKPLLSTEMKNDGVFHPEGIDSLRLRRFGAKLFRDDLVHFKNEDFELTVNPILDVHMGRDIADTGGWNAANLLFNQRGIFILGRIGQKLFFETSFFETQAIVPDYLRSFNNRYGIYPGFGRTKSYGETGYDFAMATSHVTYMPRKHIVLQIGQGKHHYGHGYRSLLWSDAGFVYPFIKARITLWKDRLTYSTMYSELRTLERLPKGEVPESLFKPKSASIHYLSFTPHPSLEIGIFESIIWNRYDSTGMHAPSAMAALPVLGLHSAAEGLNNLDNGMMGLNVCWRFMRKGMLYGQCALDNPSEQILGYQFGIRVFNIAKGLDVQGEFNSASDFMYASRFELQQYAHVNQPIGHPTGGSFQEWTLLTNYRFKRFWGEVKFHYLKQSMGPEGDFEANPDDIFITIAPWPQRELKQVDVQCGWVMQPKTRTSIVMGCTLRNSTGNLITETSTSWIWLGIRAQLLNHYNDYQ